MFVQFSDSTQTTIIATFGCPQDPKVYPNQGVVTLSDPRYAAYYASLPDLVKSAMPAPTAATTTTAA